MSFHVIEKFPCWFREGAVAARDLGDALGRVRAELAPDRAAALRGQRVPLAAAAPHRVPRHSREIGNVGDREGDSADDEGCDAAAEGGAGGAAECVMSTRRF